MASSEVRAEVEGFPGDLVIQGFRKGGGQEAYVLVAFREDGESYFASSAMLSPESAHILSEEIRKHAEHSLTEAENEEEK